MHDAVRMEKSLCEREREHETCNNFWKVLCVPGIKKKKKEPEIALYHVS